VNSLSDLLLVFHGSRTEGVAGEALAFRDALAAQGNWRSVSPAWIQFGEPSVEEALERLANDGARRVVVIPLLVLPGRHLDVDLPRAVQAFRERHPGCAVNMTGSLVSTDGFDRLIAAVAEEAGSRQRAVGRGQ